MNTSTTGNPVRRMYGKANQSGTTITNVRNTTETGGQTGHYSGTHDSTILPSTETDLHNVLFGTDIDDSTIAGRKRGRYSANSSSSSSYYTFTRKSDATTDSDNDEEEDVEKKRYFDDKKNDNDNDGNNDNHYSRGRYSKREKGISASHLRAAGRVKILLEELNYYIVRIEDPPKKG